MRKGTKTLSAVLLSMGLLLCAPSSAQSVDLEDLIEELDWQSEETLGEFRQRLIEALNNEGGAGSAALAGPQADKAVELAQRKPGTTGADGFGTRLQSSIANFLPLFSFAVDVVNTSDDDRSLTVDFNPVRLGTETKLKLSATVTEPAVGEELLGQILESARVAQKEVLEKSLGDLDDLSFSATVGFGRGPRAGHPLWRTRLLGRDARVYQPVIAELMKEVWTLSESQAQWGGFFEEIVGEAVLAADAEFPSAPLESLTRHQMEKLLERSPRPEPLNDLLLRLAREALGDFDLDQRIRSLRLDQIAHLIDNQPQLVLTLGYRSRDDLVGPDAVSATAKLEIGSRNLNRVLDEAAERGGLLAGYRHVVDETDYLAKDRFELRLTYIDRRDVGFSYAYDQVILDPMTGEETRFSRTASVVAPGSEDWCGRLTWSRSIRRQGIDLNGAPIHGRLELSAEYIAVEDDPNRQSRLVVQLGYALPLPGGVSLPLSFTYANKAEFLGEPDEQLSAHFGLSYGLDRLLGGKGRR